MNLVVLELFGHNYSFFKILRGILPLCLPCSYWPFYHRSVLINSLKKENTPYAIFVKTTRCACRTHKLWLLFFLTQKLQPICSKSEHAAKCSSDGNGEVLFLGVIHIKDRQRFEIFWPLPQTFCSLKIIQLCGHMENPPFLSNVYA